MNKMINKIKYIDENINENRNNNKNKKVNKNINKIKNENISNSDIYNKVFIKFLIFFIIFLLSLFMLKINILAEEPQKSYINISIYFEVLGAGIISSFNFDVIFYNLILFRAGYIFNKYNLGYLFGGGGVFLLKDFNYLEYGIGYAKITKGIGENTWHIYSLIGYRYQPKKFNLSYRVNFLGLFKYLEYEYMTLEEQNLYGKDTIKFILWIGLSLGFSF